MSHQTVTTPSIVIPLPVRIQIVGCPSCGVLSLEPCRDRDTGVPLDTDWSHINRQYAFAELAALIDSANPGL